MGQKSPVGYPTALKWPDFGQKVAMGGRLVWGQKTVLGSGRSALNHFRASPALTRLRSDAYDAATGVLLSYNAISGAQPPGMAGAGALNGLMKCP